MLIQQIRNATVAIEYGGVRFIIDRLEEMKITH